MNGSGGGRTLCWRSDRRCETGMANGLRMIALSEVLTPPYRRRRLLTLS